MYTSGQVRTINPSSIEIRNTVAPGTYYIVAVAGPGYGYDIETDDTNNSFASAPFSVDYSDLDATAVSYTEAGGDVAVSYQVTVGAYSIGDFTATFYLSDDATILPSDFNLGQVSYTGNRLSEEVITGSGDLFAKPGSLPAGDYHIGMIIDAAGEVPESNESNNILAGNLLTLSAP